MGEERFWIAAFFGLFWEMGYLGLLIAWAGMGWDDTILHFSGVFGAVWKKRRESEMCSFTKV